MKITSKIRVRLEKVLIRDVVQSAAEGPLLKCGYLVEGESKRLLSRGGRKKGRKTGVPSPPGTPPHSQTGNLRASIGTVLLPRARGKMPVVKVGTNAKGWYGLLHEHPKTKIFGGKRFPPREFLVPALERMKRRFPSVFKQMNMRKVPKAAALESKIRRESKLK